MSARVDLSGTDLVDAVWRKSSYTASNGNCVEVARIPATPGIAIRDSKNTDVAVTRASRPAWDAFVAAVVSGSLHDQPLG